MTDKKYLQKRASPLAMDAQEFRSVGYQLVDRVATFLDSLPERAVTPGESPSDLELDEQPFLVVGNAGSVSTGAIDPLHELAGVCREFNLWFHIDGAYRGFAAALPDAPTALSGLCEADSVAVEPHKWLYAPLEAGCALVRHPEQLRAAFAYHPPYYHFGTEAINYSDLGPQNSRGFRALKVWLAFQQVGRDAYVEMISEDIRLAQELFRLVEEKPELQAFTQSLSITTFRYVPLDIKSGGDEAEEYLDKLNRELLTRLHNSGEVYLSNALIDDTFVLRVCIVNFRTSLAGIEALLPIVAKMGADLDSELRPEGFQKQV